MKRLEIVLIGHSQTLSELNNELQSHGHGVQQVTDLIALKAWSPDGASIVIDDGSLQLHSAQWMARSQLERLSLRAGFNDTENALPELELLCWHGSTSAQRLIDCQKLPAQASGNGRELRDHAIAALVEGVALHISRLSRDPLYFASLPTALPSQSERQQGLLAVDQLLFEHQLNRTLQPDLMRVADTPLSVRLADALQTFTARAALSIGDQRYSYGDLRAHSEAIQRHLWPLIAERPTSLAPVVIGICLPKSMALYAGILAILRCGAVYLPLDPAQPVQRQQYILENSGALLLLHDGSHPLAIAEFPALDISAVPPSDDTSPHTGAQPQPDAPCMALYTSGTTGQPKGVMLSQRNLSHFTAWYADYVDLNENSRVLQFSTLSFDSSIIDIFPTWLSGAELVVPDDDQRRDPLQLVKVLKRGITHAFLPPALLSIMPLDPPLGLEHIMTGGDVCEPHVIAQLTRQCRFHNLYGPTETTVLVTAGQFESQSSNRNLGRPIANSQVWILDDQGLPVAEQTQGELYITGPGVSLGYINNPELTSERYVWLVCPDGQQLRAYRTGDMGKWTANGIELSGRRDNQVKIRGFRVEPEEIEHCLRASRLYRQVAVVVNAERRILAFLAQPCEEQPPEALQHSLRAHVQGLLPDYMHPAAYMTLAHMPYASNGKIDRKALLEIPVSFTDQPPRRLPETENEHRLVQLWAQLLEVPASDISTDESFFNLGGHSILLSRMLLGIREQFGRSIPINRFIEAPTLLTLASLIDSDASTYTISPQALEDAHAPLTLPTLPISRLGDVHKVIVTGANGFLGVHIVEALLAWGATEIACLVRESADQNAQERFEQSLKENRLAHLDLSRVTVYGADMSLPLLGLSNEVYERLDRDFGALVHNAANVNHVQDYETLVKDNVAPVFECLKLCEGRRKKIFNFVSTLSASSAVDAAGNVLEEPAAGTPPIYIKNGYNLSKWVAERILQRARDQGAWVNIYRPGNIAFNSRTGVCQPQKNRLMLMLKGSLQLGQVPEFAMTFDLMPVDFLARFIGFHASRYQPERAVFNLHNPEPLSWNSYVDAFRDAGRQFEWVSVAHWQAQLDRVDSQNALFGVLGFYLNGFEEDIGDISMIEYHNAHAGIRCMGEQYPQKTPALLRKGCDYLKEIDFI